MLDFGVTFILAMTESTSPALPVSLSLLGTVVVFILTRIAIYLYRSGEMGVRIRRYADLDPTTVRLHLLVENARQKNIAFSEFALAQKVGKELKVVAPLSGAPIVRRGGIECLQQRNGFYVLSIRSGATVEVVLEFHLSLPLTETYLCCLDDKGKHFKAKLLLNSFETQDIHFKRA